MQVLNLCLLPKYLSAALGGHCRCLTRLSQKVLQQHRRCCVRTQLPPRHLGWVSAVVHAAMCQESVVLAAVKKWELVLPVLIRLLQCHFAVKKSLFYSASIKRRNNLGSATVQCSLCFKQSLCIVFVFIYIIFTLYHSLWCVVIKFVWGLLAWLLFARPSILTETQMVWIHAAVQCI